jgi:hypothetical protein
MAVLKTMKIGLRRNGRLIGYVRDPSTITVPRIRAAVAKGAMIRLMQIVDMAIEELQGLTPKRDLVNEDKSLMEAFEIAIGGSRPEETPSGVTLRMMDTGVLDKLLPMHSAEGGSGGWWRLHEDGDNSVVGATDDYAFVSSEFLAYILGDKFKGGEVGRHGEGVMLPLGLVEKGDNAGEETMAERLHLSPYRGFKPHRTLLRMGLSMEELLSPVNFREHVMEIAAKLFCGGPA